MLKIWPYKMGSVSAKNLAEALNARRVRSDSTTYNPRPSDVIINWGNNGPSRWLSRVVRMVLNRPDRVMQATDKLRCLMLLRGNGVSVPDFAMTREEAAALFTNTRRVYCRTMLRSHSGNGIVIADNADGLVDSPLYVAGVDGHRDEFRVHVVNGEVIDFAQKRKMTDETMAERQITFNPTVRSHLNGWVFARENVTLPESARAESLAAIAALGLDFGAVDVVVRRDRPDTAYVLEVNTAPGLEGTTLERYRDAFARI